tara:strand:+ start:721 stop:993 length:273 start_codon:yes stop_codon:yes gene_type:complete
LSTDNGSCHTPFIGAGLIAIQPLARFCPNRICAINPPNECPITIGGSLSVAIILAYLATIYLTPLFAIGCGFSRHSATVLASPGQPGFRV